MNPDKIDCPCCGYEKNLLDESINYINRDSYSEFGEEVFRDRKIYHCNECKFSYSTPFLSNEVLDRFYSNSFSKSRMHSMIIQAKKKFRFSLISLQRIFFVCAFLNTKEKHTILDFGGGNGSNALQLKNLLPNSKVNIDDNDVYKDIWKLREIQKKKLTSYNDHEIDLFFSSHCFEHINANEQNQLLTLIKKKMSKNGILYIEVPNDNFSNFKNKNKMNEGCHISFFSKKSIEILMSKYFEIIDINTRGEDRVLSDEEFRNLGEIYKDNYLKKFLNKIGLLKMAQKITSYYHINFTNNQNEKKKLIGTMFFKKNINADKGSYISILVRNKN